MDLHYSYILLKPDLIIRNLFDLIHMELESKKFELVDFRIGKLNYELYQIMYSSHFKWEFDYWFHNYSIYKFSPVVSLLLYRSTVPKTFSSNQEYLASLKGHTLPQFSKANTLRKTLNAYSRVLNLVHIPDNNTVANVEASVWFNNEGLDNKYMSTCSCDFSKLKIEIEKHGYFSESLLDFELILEYLKYRFLYSFKKHFNLQSEQFSLISMSILETISLLKKIKVNDEKRVKILNKSHKNEIRIARSIKLKELQNYNDILMQNYEDFINILENIHNKNFTPQLESYFWSLADKFMVFYSEFEKYLIETSFKYNRLTYEI